MNRYSRKIGFQVQMITAILDPRLLSTWAISVHHLRSHDGGGEEWGYMSDKKVRGMWRFRSWIGNFMRECTQTRSWVGMIREMAW